MKTPRDLRGAKLGVLANETWICSPRWVEADPSLQLGWEFPACRPAYRRSGRQVFVTFSCGKKK